MVLIRCLVGVSFALAVGSCDSDTDEPDELHAIGLARDTTEREAIARIYEYLDRAEVLRDQPAVPAAQRARLDADIAAARRALRRFVELRRRGQTRGVVMARIGAASALIVANDVTGVGVVDDWLLIPCGVGAIANWILTSEKAPADAIEAAWDDIGTQLQALQASTAAAAVACGAATPASCPPSVSDPPDTAPEAPVAPSAPPAPAARPRPRAVPTQPIEDDDTDQRCRPQPACPHLPINGDEIHHACADAVPPNVFPGCDVLVNGKRFDALDPRGVLWEIKTDDWSNYTEFLKERTLDLHAATARVEHRLAAECGHSFIFAVADRGLYDALRQILEETVTVRHIPQCQRQVKP